MILPPVELAVRSSVDIECCLIYWTENSYHADLAAVTVVGVVEAWRLELTRRSP